MKRREFITIIGSAAAAWPLAGRAQQLERMRRIGILTALPENQPAGMQISVIKRRLEELGWAEGRNVSFEYRLTRGQPDLIRKHAAELAAMGLDVIFSSSAPNVVALHKETSTTPIVFIFVSDPVGMGVVKDMARPGGNITGFAAFEPSLGGKWLELLKEVAPSVWRAAIVYNPNTAPNSPAFIGPAQTAGTALGVSVVLKPVRDDVEVDSVTAEFAREPGAGLIQVPDPFTAARPNLLAGAAMRNRLPLISPFRWMATAGALISYGIDATEQNRQAAGYIGRILKGEKPADLPVQLPTKFELIINLKAAKALGLTVPPTLLARADEVIE